MKVVVLGQGYVGLPLALAVLRAGHHAVGFDIDVARVALLRDGRSYVTDVPDAEVAEALGSGRYEPTDDPDALAGFNVAVIAVPTGLRDGAPDLGHIETAARSLGEHLRRGATVVLESTTYPGTTRELVAPLLAEGSGLVAGRDFHLGYSPERVDPGNTEWTYATIPKLVSGIDEASLAAVSEFYGSFVDTVVPVADTAVAEMAKLLENTFRHVNVALVNELALFARALGVDLGQAIDAASTKPFGFMPFRPGPGVGGHCLPVDPTYLSWRVEQQTGERFRFVDLANQVNDRMPHHVASRVVVAAAATAPRTVLVLGLAYKADTGDLRGSPALAVVEDLCAAGLDVVAADPLVADAEWPAHVRRVEATPEEVRAAGLVVVLAAHSAFDLPMVQREARHVFDTRRCLTGPHVEHL